MTKLLNMLFSYLFVVLFAFVCVFWKGCDASLLHLHQAKDSERKVLIFVHDAMVPSIPHSLESNIWTYNVCLSQKQLGHVKATNIQVAAVNPAQVLPSQKTKAMKIGHDKPRGLALILL